MRVTRQDVRLALALCCLLTSWYWLTADTYIESYDGETAFAVTESLVERGTFVQPEEHPGAVPRAIASAPDGKRYAVTAPLQSLLAIPFYWVGQQIARCFPPPFYGYFTRFFTVLFTGMIGAATAALLYLFGVDLGYRRRTALFIALAYGLATISWPYARTFFAETLHTFWLVLAAWAVYRYAHTDRWEWMAVTGAALGLGVLSKYVMAVAGPAFVLYLCLEFWRRPDWHTRRRWAIQTLLAGGIPFLLLIGLLMGFDYIRFGNVWETGYTMETTRGSISTWGRQATPLVSWYGYFFSSGKGFFFFSPPTVLFLWSVAALARRRRNELVLWVSIAISYPLFYSLISWRWFGGANWGPRYIVCITPFLLLPIGAFLERRDLPRWLRLGSATFLFVVGVWVQIGILFVNPSYLYSSTPFSEMLFHPAHSTILKQWRVWPERLRGWLEYDHERRLDGSTFYTLEGDFHAIEVPAMAPLGRWMGQRGRLRIYVQPKQDLTFQIHYSRPRGTEAEEWEGLQLFYDGVELAGDLQCVAEKETESQWVQTASVAADAVHVFPGTLEITAATRPTGALNGDQRELSVFISDAQVLSNGVPLQMEEVKLPRPLPVTTAYTWSENIKFWFYDPTINRPLNMWPWYLWISGVPLAKARALIIVLVTLFGGGMLAGGLWFVRLVQRNLVIK